MNNEPALKGEPVAWMSSVNGETVYVGYEPADGWLAIPLYTHPAKTLTDEEIWKANPDDLITITKKQWLDGLNSEWKKGIRYSCEKATLKEVLDALSENHNSENRLTDEEINECWERFMGTDDYTRIDIARAILRKANEK